MNNNSLLKRIISLMLAVALVFQLNGITVLATERVMGDITNKNVNLIEENNKGDNTQKENNNAQITTQSEEEGVELLSVGIEKNEIHNLGEETKVYVNVTKHNEINYIEVVYGYSVIKLDYNSESGRFEGVIKGDQNFSLDTITKLESIYINAYAEDIYINREQALNDYGIDLSMADFKVIQWQPQINSIEMESKIIEFPNGESKIAIDVEEADTLDYIVLEYSNEYYSDNSYLELYFNEDTGKFETTIYAMNYSYEEGYNTQKLEKIYFNAKNSESQLVLNRDELVEHILEGGQNEDILDFRIEMWSATIKSITLENKIIDYNQSGKVYIEVDRREEIYSIELRYDIPNYYDYNYVYLNYNESTGRFEGDINLSYNYNYDENMNDFNLNAIVIYKNYENEYIYRNEINSKYGLSENVADFKVTKKIPKVTSIELENNVITYPNDTTKIYMDVTEKDIINSIRLDYYSEIYGYYNNVYLYYNSEIGKYEGTISISNYIDDKFRINSINIDYNSGYETYTRSDLNNKFGINVEDADYKQEKERVNIKSFISENNTIYPNVYGASSIKLKMEVENPQDIYSITVRYGSRYNDYSDFYVYMRYNYETGLFEGETYPYYYMLGENEVKEVYIYKYYGTITLSKEDLNTYENIDLDSLTVNITPYGPKDIYVDTKAINVGETVTIKADLSNYPLEIKTVRLNYNYDLNSGSEFYIEMKYNGSTGLYEGQYTAGRLTEGGTKTVHAIEIVDKNNNWNAIYNDSYEMNLNNANFEVSNNVDKFLYSINVQVDSNKGQLNDKIKVSLSLEDLKGNYVEIMYTNVKTNASKYISLVYNKKTNKWEGYFNVNTYDSDGVWAIDNISLSEIVNDNTKSIMVYNREFNKDKRYTKDFSKADIKITGTLNDIKAPELISIEVDKNQVEIGDIVTISVNAKDDLSGINYINAELYNGQRTIYLYDFKYNPLTGKYEKKIKITAADLNGTYRVENISLADNMYNQVYIRSKFSLKSYSAKYADLSAATFEVVNNIDNYGEILQDISISNKEVTADDSIEMAIRLNNRAGIKALKVTYLPQASYEYEKQRSIYLTYDSNKHKYIGTLNIDDDMEVSDWQINDIALIDEEDYQVAYLYKYMDYKIEELMNNATFSVVYKEVEDINSINLNYFALDKNKITANETINIVAKASAANGEVRKIAVEYITNSTEKKLHQIKLIESENGFTGQFTASEFISPGEWKVNKVVLEDNDRNKKIIWNTSIDENSDKYGMNLSAANFEIYGTVLDNTSPELVDVIIDKEVYVLGDKIKVSIEAKDDIAGVKSVKAIFLHQQSGGSIDPIEFVYNEENSMFEYTIDTTESYAFFENWSYQQPWIIVDLYIEDNAGNTNNLGYYNNEILRSVYFYVNATESWFISDLTDKSEFVNGVTEANANIKITIGDKIYFGKSDNFGKFKIAIPTQEGNTVVNVKIKNSKEQVIQDIEKVVQDIHEPEIPLVTTIVNNKTTVLEGVAEANSTVVIEKEVKVFGGIKIEEIARTVADSEGNFKVNIPMQSINTYLGVKAIDEVGNISEYANIIVKNVNREDVNYDDIIDILDLALVARKYNTVDGDNMWDTNLDVNEDGVVDIFDIVMISKKME